MLSSKKKMHYHNGCSVSVLMFMLPPRTLIRLSTTKVNALYYLINLQHIATKMQRNVTFIQLEDTIIHVVVRLKSLYKSISDKFSFVSHKNCKIVKPNIREETDIDLSPLNVIVTLRGEGVSSCDV